ncbi:YppF family protein [Lentibacillus sp. L22]|uniref:YppF family protein n=1 Tax=Lentibacillus TaxID=175304 RepID=UPI0022B1A313|nr:YppF family protein [Lentibacillus daqui]
MQLEDMMRQYALDREETHPSINQLLDFYQKQYVAGEIDITTYQDIFHFLHEQGATSSHEYI